MRTDVVIEVLEVGGLSAADVLAAPETGTVVAAGLAASTSSAPPVVEAVAAPDGTRAAHH